MATSKKKAARKRKESERRERNREFRAREREVLGQHKRAAVRAKYGPVRRPAPVVVKSLATGEVVEVLDQRKFRSRRFSGALEARAQALGYVSYAAYLASAHWAALRVCALERDCGRCRGCGTRANLTVHHETYDRLGAELLEDLATLCGRCHQRLHRR